MRRSCRPPPPATRSHGSAAARCTRTPTRTSALGDHVHFRAPDLEAAVTAATSAGGSSVCPVETSAADLSITLRDPGGGLFTILAPQG
ncbi:VOC family protein [Streptomyces sp. NPDC059957]|uniref:VOC family protein n=1 Tax=unclassified Streptomyces TaxID=2593676 RepID=UPI003662D532